MGEVWCEKEDKSPALLDLHHFLFLFFRGADDLLPVMSYVVVKSQLPQLVSECRALSEFIHEGSVLSLV